jgi:iron complex outermembrane receptor protein
MVDGVRIYLPADNRLDFGRFLTADLSAVQIQKGYASVIDGPGAMGGAINLVTRKPSRTFESESGAALGGREALESWSAYTLLGTRVGGFYAQAGVNYSDRDFWTLPGSYTPTPNSLQPAGDRLSSDTQDWRVTAKVGYMPTEDNEYTFNYMRQEGEKGAPLNVYNNPPVPPNTYWRWPWWNLQNASFLSNTQLGDEAYVKGKVYYNTFDNALDAFDNGTYTTQSANGRFRSTYTDYAYGTGIEFGVTGLTDHVIKTAFHHRVDVHTEFQESRRFARLSRSSGNRSTHGPSPLRTPSACIPRSTSLAELVSISTRSRKRRSSTRRREALNIPRGDPMRSIGRRLRSGNMTRRPDSM